MLFSLVDISSFLLYSFLELLFCKYWLTLQMHDLICYLELLIPTHPIATILLIYSYSNT
jgi:hypothetical protein